jgi:hypothetical protein
MQMNRVTEIQMRQGLAAHAQIMPKPPEDWLFSSMYDFVHHLGSASSSRPLPKRGLEPLRNALKEMVHMAPRQKECFRNAFLLASILDRRGLGGLYCEGYAWDARFPFPIHHAWVSWRGRAIDVTWRQTLDRTATATAAQLQKFVEGNIKKNSYYGVPLDLDYVANLNKKERSYRSAIDDWRHKWPLLRLGQSVSAS